jgi:enolase
LELRDGDPLRFRGMSVFTAIRNIETLIGPELLKKNPLGQTAVDRCMIDLDGTSQKSRLGANATLAVSMAYAYAAATSSHLPLYAYLGAGTLLPFPEIQIIGGGAHANWRTDVQDFLVMAIGAQTFEQAIEITYNVYQATADALRERGKLYGVADEGGFWPEVESHEQAFELLLSAIHRAGYRVGTDVALSLDIAASNLYDERTRKYTFRSENRSFDSEAFANLLAGWCGAYDVVSIEDPMAENDWDGWQQFRSVTPSSLQIVGDDIFVTNVERIRAGIDGNVANAVLIKPNQIGTVTETLDAIRLTQSAGWEPVVSARSGETEDAFIAHLAVATEAGQLKVGSLARSERVAKWNEVLRIGRKLGAEAKFGRKVPHHD